MIKRLTASCMLIVYFMLVVWGCGKNEATLARIGKRITISVDDFQKSNTLFRKSDSLEKDLETLHTKLDEMIDTKLILLGAYEAGYDQDSIIVETKKAAQNKESIQKLYQHEIVNKYVHESDIRDFYSKTGYQVVISTILIEVPPKSDSVVVSLIRKDAETLLKKLHNGESFELLASKYSQDRRTAINGGRVGTLEYTRIGDPIQEAAFSMKPGEISDILQTEKGFNILKVNEIKKIDQKPYMEIRKKIKSSIVNYKKQQINEYAIQYWNDLKKKNGVCLQTENLDTLFKIMRTWNTFITDSVLNGLDNLPDTLKNMTLITYRGGIVTIPDYKDWLIRIIGRPEIRGGIPQRRFLERMMDNLLMERLLYNAAKKKGLHNHPDVKREVLKAYERKMIQLFTEREIWGPIDPSEKEISEYYQIHLKEKYTPPVRYKLQEIVVETEELANQIVAWAKQGQPFSSLVQKHSIKPGKERNQGLEENVTKKRKPIHFACANSLLVGDIGGPLKLRENRYSIIKVLERIEPDPRPFNKIKSRVRMHLINSIKKDRKREWLEAKHSAVHIEIDEAVLKNILNSYYSEKS